MRLTSTDIVHIRVLPSIHRHDPAIVIPIDAPYGDDGSSVV
jgi:hypothetical protein